MARRYGAGDSSLSPIPEMVEAIAIMILCSKKLREGTSRGVFFRHGKEGSWSESEAAAGARSAAPEA